MDEQEKKEIITLVRNRLDYSKEENETELKKLIAETIQEYSKDKFISLSEKEELLKTVFDSIRKLDILQELIEDDEVTEIMVNAHNRIFYEKNGKMILWDKIFESEEKLTDVIQHIVAECDRTVTLSSPVVDARLKDGSRVCVVLSPPSVKGNTVTIRKFSKKRLGMPEMVEMGTITKEAADFLKDAVQSGYNILISGGTSSGKTTFLNALSDYIPVTERVITIEDSAELNLSSIENLVSLETKNKTDSGGRDITMRDLIVTALRMRPDRIVIGEVRAEECFDMLQALNTGHDGSMTTAHANGIPDMLSRLEAMVLMAVRLPGESIRMQIVSGLDLIIYLERTKEGKRRVIEISELAGIEDGMIQLNPIFTCDFDSKSDCMLKKTGELIHTGKLKSAAGLIKRGEL